jgi:hypothetical protein
MEEARLLVGGVSAGIPPDSHGFAGCQRNQMVLDTASMTMETTVGSQLSTTVSEGDF